jgi:hypothetical protein
VVAIGLGFPSHAKAGEGESRSDLKFESGSQDEDGICLPVHVLASLGLEIAIQVFDPTGEAACVVLLSKQHDPKILR